MTATQALQHAWIKVLYTGYITIPKQCPGFHYPKRGRGEGGGERGKDRIVKLGKVMRMR